MNSKVLMAERSDLYHDARVQKEAVSLRNAGYDVTVLGLRSSRKSNDVDFPFKMKTLYVLPREYGVLRKMHLFLLILFMNVRIVFMKFNFYHSHNTYMLAGMYLAKKIYGGKLIYDSHEVQWELNKLAAIQEKLFIEKVDYIINVSLGRAKAQSVKYNIPLSKICVVSNYPLFNSELKVAREYLNNQQIKFVFSGGLNLSDNKIDNFIKAIKEFPNISLDLLTFSYGNSAFIIKELIKDLGIDDRVKFIPLVKPNEVLETIAKYDYTVNMMINPKNLISVNYHSINKIYESISAGLPILCSDLPAFNDEIVNNGIGYSVNPFSIDSIQDGLRKVIVTFDRHYLVREKAFRLAESSFNWQKEELKLINLYNTLEKVCAE